MELFLLCSDDAESDVRMVADECLNKVIKVRVSLQFLSVSLWFLVSDGADSIFSQPSPECKSGQSLLSLLLSCFCLFNCYSPQGKPLRWTRNQLGTFTVVEERRRGKMGWLQARSRECVEMQKWSPSSQSRTFVFL